MRLGKEATKILKDFRRADREAYLDAWWKVHRESYGDFHRRFKGSGKKMIEAFRKAADNDPHGPAADIRLNIGPFYIHTISGKRR